MYGLLRHSTEVSGTTLFLPHPEVLPLADIPILGSVTGLSTVDHVRNLAEMARRSPRGGCLQVSAGGQDAVSVRELGAKIAGVLREVALPARQPLVLLVRENIGKVLGQYVTAWGALDLNLVVIDELRPGTPSTRRLALSTARWCRCRFMGSTDRRPRRRTAFSSGGRPGTTCTPAPRRRQPPSLDQFSRDSSPEQREASLDCAPAVVVRALARFLGGSGDKTG